MRKPRLHRLGILPFALFLLASCRGADGAVSPRQQPYDLSLDQAGSAPGIAPAKTNPQNPNVIVDQATGRRQIAAHYYPLIGPYSSNDPDVVEYHCLLMKYAGIDGILIDWYGSREVSDYGTNLHNSNVLISRLRAVGLTFAVVYEDWTCGYGSPPKEEQLANARLDLAYLSDFYFSRPEYKRLGAKDLFLVFGPRTFNSAADWSGILEGHVSTLFLPLCYRMGGAGASSEFMWPYQDAAWPAPGTRSHKDHLEGFNAGRAKALAYPVAVAYPGFDDFYAEGGAAAARLILASLASGRGASR